MRQALRYTLLTDGSSDAVLVPLLTWVLEKQGVRCAIQPVWADIRPVLEGRKKKTPIEDKMIIAIEKYPCDLLFVHRDAEQRHLYEKRMSEIFEAQQQANLQSLPVIGVVPVQMQEAWLLFNEQAIKEAAGNPNGKANLNLPLLRNMEDEAYPKKILHDKIALATNLKGRRLEAAKINFYARRVANYIEDFSLLHVLPAFQKLEEDVATMVKAQGWDQWE